MEPINPTTYKGKLPLSATKEFAQNAIGFTRKLKGINPQAVSSNIVFKDFLFIFDADITSQILKDQENFKKSFAYDYLAMILGNGLLTAEGEEWKGNRRKMQPVFSPKGIEGLFDSIHTKVVEDLESLKDKKEFYCLDYMRNLAAKVVLYSLFSELQNATNLSDLIDNLVGYANYRMKTPFALPSGFPTKRNRTFKANLRRLDDFILNIIAQRKKEVSKDDFLSYLMDIKTEDGQTYFSEKQLKDELVTLYIAGQETTASVLTFAIHELMKNPEILQKMKAEIDTVDALTYQNLGQLKYVEQVLNESMRMYPPGWGLSREVAKDVEVNGLKMKKGCTLFLPIYHLHHDEKIWESPEKFIPERFEDKVNEHYYLPFGTGARICIGKYFSLIEMKIIFYYLFKNYQLELEEGFELQLKTPMTLSPKFDFKLNCQKV
jgi:cytochrome P450